MERESRWERSGMCLERVPEQGDLETTLPWPPPWGRFLGGDKVSEIWIDR